MSGAIKCDRCGACYEYGGMTVGEEYDLCDGCVADFEAWMERGQMADTSERVTNDGEMSYDTREKLEAAVQTAAGYIYGRGFTNGLADAWNDDEVDTAANQIIQLLDRQAAITERECREYEDALRGRHYKRITELRAERDESAQRIQTLEREIATLKEHRAANVEKLHELTDECAELRKCRDEWKGIAEAAWAECDGYRAKLGAVLDAICEAERAAR